MNKLVIVFLLTSIASFAQISHQWERSFSARGDYSAKYTCIAKDFSGNFYLGGYTVTIDNNRDYLVAKLNSNGDTLWTRIFRGTDNSGDEINAIAVDKNANVYVTGFANGNGTGNDILTIKLSTNGDTLWKRFYNYTANEDDNGNSIAVDTAGNVFVTGESDSNPTNIDNYDFITLKYDPNGNQLWAVRYGSTGTDKAVKVQLDLVGNCFVTGRAFNGIDDNFATIKYNSSGVQQWVKTYDGGANDRAIDMAIDSTYSFIYVTGRSDNGNDDDMITLKYNASSGALSWTKSYNNVDDDRPIAITIDNTGVVYVTGQSDADASTNRNWNIVTVKYASSSSQLWVKSYNSSLTNADIPIGINVNQTGDVYVAGQSDTDPSAVADNFSFTTLKYNTGGVLQWTRTFSGNGISTGGAEAMLLTNSGIPVVVGSTENTATQKDAIAIMYDASGNVLWNKSYLGSGDNSDNGYSIFVDAAENTFVAGYSVSEETDRNMTTAKINSLGDTQWVRIYNGTSSINLDVANDIKVDGSGNSFVVGSSKNSGTSNDFTTIKYNANGDSIWVRKYNNALVNGSDKANSIDIDASSNSYVCGYSETTNGTLSDDFLTIKYDANGLQQWAVKYNGPGNGEDRAYFVKVNAAHVFVCGRVWNGSNFDYAVKIYTLSGSPVATGFYDGSGDDFPTGMVLDANENIYITGKSASGLGNPMQDYATVKFNVSGSLVWSKRYNGVQNANDEANAIAVDVNANVFVTGTSDADFTTIAYNSNGDTLWTRRYNGVANLNDAAKAIAIDTYGNCFVTGEVENGSASISNLDIVTLKYSPAGNLLVNASFSGAGNGKDSPNGISIKNDNVFVCGESYSNAASQKDLIVLKYNTFTLGSSENVFENASVKLFPNPAKECITIEIPMQMLSEKNTYFVLYNQLGKEIKRIELVHSTKQTINREGLISGLYYYKILSVGAILDAGKISFQ